VRKKTRHLLTRVELSRALPASLSAVDRAIAAGLKPAGQRDRAKLYRRADARRFLQRQRRESENLDLIALVDAKVRATRAKLARLREQYVTPEQVKREWSYLVARVREGATQMLDALPSTDPAIITRDVRALLVDLAKMRGTTSSRPTRPLPVVRTSPTLRAARVQHARFQARLIDLRDAITSGAVVPRETAIRDGQTRVIAAKHKLLALPRVPARAGSDPAQSTAALRRAVDEALDELEFHNQKETAA
jgi:hypothetical protein